MVKRWLKPPHYDRPGSHLEFFLKIQHVHGQKMTDPPNDTPGSYLEFLLKIVHGQILIIRCNCLDMVQNKLHGQRWLDPPSMTDQDLTYNFKQI